MTDTGPRIAVTQATMDALLQLADAECAYAQNFGIVTGNELVAARIRYQAARENRPPCTQGHDWIIRKSKGTVLARNICSNCGELD